MSRGVAQAPWTAARPAPPARVSRSSPASRAGARRARRRLPGGGVRGGAVVVTTAVALDDSRKPRRGTCPSAGRSGPPPHADARPTGAPTPRGLLLAPLGTPRGARGRPP